jgi:hypothetical protein
MLRSIRPTRVLERKRSAVAAAPKAVELGGKGRLEVDRFHLPDEQASRMGLSRCRQGCYAAGRRLMVREWLSRERHVHE